MAPQAIEIAQNGLDNGAIGRLAVAGKENRSGKFRMTPN
jgi:hypothetical protein